MLISNIAITKIGYLDEDFFLYYEDSEYGKAQNRKTKETLKIIYNIKIKEVSKGDGKIYPKHIKIIDVMEQNGWFLKSKKIWVKSYKVNMFRMNYMNILTFAKRPFKVKNPHDPDVIYDDKSTIVKGFKFGMSLEVCKKLILNYTKEGDIVYDPFMGSGTTAVASFDTDRKILGSEVNPEYVKIIKERIGLGEFMDDKF